MNEPKQPSQPSEHDDADLPPAATGPADVGSTVVFAGNPARVSAGLAIALQLLGVDTAAPEPGPDDRTLRRK